MFHLHSTHTMHSLGLLSDELVELAGSPLDALCSHLQNQLQYRPGERDAVYLHHFVGIEWPNKKVRKYACMQCKAS